MKNLILVTLLFLISCVNDVNIVNTQSVLNEPDIRTKIMVPFNGIFNLNQTKDIVVTVSNVGTSETVGSIMLMFPTMYGYEITFDATQITANNPTAQLNNSEFTLIPFNGNLLLSTNTVIFPGKAMNIGFKLKAAQANANNIVNVSALPYTGGEGNITNNVARINIVSLP